MKKSLSLLVAITMVFSMFASVAFAADKAAPSQDEKFAALKELGIFTGFPDGSAGLNLNMTRAQFAKVLTVGTGLEENAAASKYSDVSATHWAKPFIGAVTEAGLMQGVGNNKFNPNGNVTIQELAKTLVLSLGLEPVEGAEVAGASAWAVGYVQAALDAKIIPSFTNYNVAATRGQLVDAIYEIVNGEQVTVKSAVATDEKTVKVTFSDDQVVTKTLDTALELGKATKVSVEYNGTTYEVEVTFEGAAVAKAEAVGVKKVKVTFAGAVDSSKVTFAIKQGTSVYSVITSKTAWNDAKTEATLETSIALPAGDVSVTASGLKFSKDSATFTVAPERAESVKIDDNGYRQDMTVANLSKVTVGFNILNQYGEDITSSYVTNQVSVTPNTVGVTLTSVDLANKVIKLDGVGADKSAVSLTVVELKSAKSSNKEVKIQNSKLINEVTLSAPVLPTGKTAFAEGMTDIVFPYVAKDQFGNDVKLVTADLANLTFVSSDTNVIDPASKKVTADNKLTFDIKAGFEGPKSVSLTVIVNNSAKSSKVEFNANGKKSPAEPTLVVPSTKFGLGGTYNVELQVKDQFGNAMTADEIVAASSKFTIIAGNNSIFTAAGSVTKADGKAVVVLTGAGKGTANITVTVNSTSKSATATVTVVDAKVTSSLVIAPVDGITKAVNKASVSLKATFADQYGDAFTSGNAVVKVIVSNTDFGAAPANQTDTSLKDNGVTFTATGADKSTKVTFELYDTVAHANAADSNVDTQNDGLLDSQNVTLTSAKADEALTYEVEALGTLATAAGTAYAKDVKVFAKDAAGTKVALKASETIQEVKSGNTAAVTVSGSAGAYKVKAVGTEDAETNINVTIAKADGNVQVIVAPVKVSKAAPVVATLTAKVKGDAAAAKVTIDAGTYDLTKQDDTKGSNNIWFEAKDQFGTIALSPQVSIYVYDEKNGLNKVTDATAVAFAAGTYKVTASIGDKSVTVEVEAK